MKLTFALVCWQGQDARQVVVVLAVLLFAEVAHCVIAITVHFTKDVEQEWIHIIVECLVVQEQLAEQAEVLAVHLVGLAVNLEE